MNNLTEKTIKAAKPRHAPYKLSDGGGLHLLVAPAGGYWWRFRYRWQGREQMLSLGVYPDVSLKLARDRRDAARKQLVQGVKPTATWRAEPVADGHTFQAVADAWLALREKEVAAGELSAATVVRDHAQLKRWIHPDLGARPVAGITTAELLAALKKIEADGKHDTTYRTRETCERVFKYAKRMGLAKENPAEAEMFEGAFASRMTRHYAAITDPAKVGALLRAIEEYDGQPATHAALRVAPYVFVRPGELRAAAWSEFDLQNAEWRIPAARMKMRDAHIVPLARQVVAILKELEKLTGRGRFVFPAIGTGERPLSNNTLGAALRRLGYSSAEMTAHGFRSMASTLLNEQGFPPDVIELQLAHRERNAVRAIYNRAQRLDERKKMMQAWANHLDKLREKATKR